MYINRAQIFTLSPSAHTITPAWTFLPNHCIYLYLFLPCCPTFKKSCAKIQTAMTPHKVLIMEKGVAISPEHHVNEIQDTGLVHIDATKGDADNVSSKSTSQFEVDFAPQEQRKIIRRIDLRLVVTVGIMYCVSLMDRTNMSAANIAGMKVELHLGGFQYVSVILLP